MKKTDLDRWGKYFAARNDGISIEAAAKKAKLSPSTAYRFERGDPEIREILQRPLSLR